MVLLSSVNVTTSASVVASFLITGLGVGAVVAGIVGALLVERIIKPAMDAGHDVLCENWNAEN